MVETRKALVTGGAGFIGSHLVDRLLEDGWEVVVFDNMTSGEKTFLEDARDEGAEVIIDDCLDLDALEEAAWGCEMIAHCAADPDVRIGPDEPTRHFEQNVMATQNALEACRRAGCETFLFTSTSTVYGETKVFPTPEDFGPMKPISTYGASKLASDALVSGHAYTFDFDAICYRFANILGPRLTHGVVYDFVHKLRDDPTTLEILGDGKQQKSYCHVDDVLDGMLTMYEHEDRDQVEMINVGTESWTSVTQIADLVCEAMGLEGVSYEYTGGVEGGRGWKGDIKKMRLGIDTLTGLGWEPDYTSDEAVKVTAEWMAENT